MKTDTDALAAYAEAWKPGDPLPAGMSINRVIQPEPELISVGWQDRVWSTPEWPDDCVQEMAQALTGVLVVELARQDVTVHWTAHEDVFFVSGGDLSTQLGPFDVYLCALVAAWLEVNK